MRILPCFLLFLFTFSNSIAQQKPQVVPGNIIVQIPDGRVDDVIANNQFLNGQPTGLKLNRLLSEPMAAYLLEFDPAIHHTHLLRQIWDHPGVSLIQLNHYIHNRNTTPNDPQLNQQWWHLNDGSAGGTTDADIDSDEAWDITTGGVTALGDTIVVCVVDDGGDLDHPDLMANNWVNHHEIPNNNIDDDNNGYVDDYLGWDPVNDNDNVDGGGHGVNVAGMIGAVGDNGIGVTGVNWSVKIMNMTYGSIGSANNPNEANVIEAYTYPLIMRRLYESTSGAQGAFVVATNSSWGLDNADPSDAPIWCAFYDTLGSAGILSAGATANNNVNIDVVGDLPTACSSEYLISVTATNNQDVRTFSGYGQTTVDLGAPGEDVRTTANGGSYTTTSGTSFASPATAGAIALMYSAPCASLAAIAHADPALAAQMVRNAIFNGVDPVPNLLNECVTGGRLNIKGALDEILSNCTNGGCMPPFSINVYGVTDVLAEVSFAHMNDVDTFNLFFGAEGQAGTLITDLTTSPYEFNGLTPCTEYWVAMQSVCDGEAGEWTDSIYFATDGCCIPPYELVLSAPTDTSITAIWSGILAAEGYQIQWRPTGTSIWDEATVTNGVTQTLTSLLPCTEYEVRVATNCAGGTTEFSTTQVLTTTGCGACTDLTFCSSYGNTQFEWIESITVGDLSNTSGASVGGYEDHTDLSVDLQRGETYTVTLVPEFSGQSYTEHFRIWVDLNQNGTFSTSEMLFDDDQGSQSAVTGTITVPLNAELGSARMRISMAYGSQFGGDYPQSSCEQEHDGEVEDYCVNILEEDQDTVPDGVAEHYGFSGMSIYPNPATDQVTVQLNDHKPGKTQLQLLDMTGRLLQTRSMTTDRITLDLTSFSKGIYVIQVMVNSEVTGRARLLKQ